MKPIFVTGGTGGIGAHLVHMLVDAGHTVRVLTRDPARARQLLVDGVEFIEGDLHNSKALASGMAGCERVFFLSTNGERHGAEATVFAKLAREANVRHVVAISSGTIEMKPTVALGTWHLELENAFTDAGLATTFLRPDNFSTNALRWSGLIRAKGMVFSTAPDSQSCPIDSFDIAAVAFAALTQPGHENKIYTLSGPAPMTVREQVDIIAKEIGKPLNVVQIPNERARASMVENGVPAAMADAILELMGHPPRPTSTVLEVTHRAPRSFAQWVRENRNAFA